ncbi:hypothetical protein NKG94_17570 [Micromonospora sp. M12]
MEQVITAALAAGAGAGLKDTASAAVRDAYAGLKALLKQRFGGREGEAVQALEADETEPGVWQARIGEAWPRPAPTAMSRSSPPPAKCWSWLIRLASFMLTPARRRVCRLVTTPPSTTPFLTQIGHRGGPPGG